MIVEAKKQREAEFKKRRMEELTEVKKVQEGIAQEKQDKINKKIAEREYAQKVIQENEIEKKKRLREKEIEKEKQNKIIEEYNRMLDAQDKKRAEEWAAREEKIKNAMSKMADTVLKKSNAADKELEARVIHYANERDRLEAEKERKKQE